MLNQGRFIGAQWSKLLNILNAAWRFEAKLVPLRLVENKSRRTSQGREDQSLGVGQCQKTNGSSKPSSSPAMSNFSPIQDSTCWPGWEATCCIGTSALDILRLTSEGKGRRGDFWSMDVQNRWVITSFKNFQEVACSSVQYLESFQPDSCNHGLTFFFRWAIAKVRMGRIPHTIGISATNGMSEKLFQVGRGSCPFFMVFETSLLFRWLIVIAFEHARAFCLSLAFSLTWPVKRGLNFIVAVELLAGLTEKQTLGGLKSLTDSWLKAMQFSMFLVYERPPTKLGRLW